MYTLLGQSRKSGFSILMAIGSIGVLLVIVTSLSMTYIREGKISRYSYDDVIVSAAAEGQFEYAMLKISNHRDGFSDSVNYVDPDGKSLSLSTSRSSGLQSAYTIQASSTGYVFSIPPGEHLIVPLFVGTGSLIGGGISSIDPVYNTEIIKTQGLNTTDLSNTQEWTITAMSGSQSISMSGTGNISDNKTGTIRIQTSQCYSANDGSPKLCTVNGMNNLAGDDEELLYSYDIVANVHDFLQSNGTIDLDPDPATEVYMKITDPILTIYNASASDSINTELKSDTPFALTTLTIQSTATKGESTRRYQFKNNKSRYFDALKYGAYNPE